LNIKRALNCGVAALQDYQGCPAAVTGASTAYECPGLSMVVATSVGGVLLSLLLTGLAGRGRPDRL